MEFLSFFENSGLAIWLRESPSILAYPTLLAFHTFGMAFLVGFSAAVGLRLLGIASSVPLAPLRKFFPVMQIAFAVSLISGVLLFILDARLFITMPVFYIKLAAIVGALTILRTLRVRVFSVPVPREEPFLAGAMLLCWMIALSAGRVTAYAPFIGWQSGIAVIVLAGLLLTGRYIVLRSSGAKTSA